MPPRAFGALFALAAALAFATALAGAVVPKIIPGWWDGHPTVNDKLIERKDVHVGLLAAYGCNLGENVVCADLKTKDDRLLVGYAELGALGLIILTLFAMARSAWKIGDYRKLLGKVVLVEVALVAGGGIALFLVGPQIIVDDHPEIHVVVPIGIGMMVFWGAVAAAGVASVIAIRLEPEPLRLKRSEPRMQQPAPEPAFDVHQLLAETHEPVRPGTAPRFSAGRGSSPGPMAPQQPAPQLRPLYDVHNAGVVPAPAAPPLPSHLTPMPRAAVGQIMGIPTPPPMQPNAGPQQMPPHMQGPGNTGPHMPMQGMPGNTGPQHMQGPGNTGPHMPMQGMPGNAGPQQMPPPHMQGPGNTGPHMPMQGMSMQGMPGNAGPPHMPMQGMPGNPGPQQMLPPHMQTPPQQMQMQQGNAPPPLAPPPTPPSPMPAMPGLPGIPPVAGPRTAPSAAVPAPRAIPPPAARGKPSVPPPVRGMPAPKHPTISHAIPPPPSASNLPAPTTLPARDSAVRVEGEPITAVEIDAEAKAKHAAMLKMTPAPALGDSTDKNMMPPVPVERTDESATVPPPPEGDAAMDRPSDASLTVPRERQSFDAMETVARPKQDDAPEDLQATMERNPKERQSQPKLERPASKPAEIPISTAPTSLPPPKKTTVTMTGPTPACPQCEAPMAWVEEHLRFYCAQCRMYF